jgi:hypothetical protein
LAESKDEGAIKDALAPVLQQLDFHVSKFRLILEEIRDESDGCHLVWTSRQCGTLSFYLL